MNLDTTTQKIECSSCGKSFNDDDIVSIFDNYICDDCIDYFLKNNPKILRKMIKTTKVDSEDINYLLYRLEIVNKK